MHMEKLRELQARVISARFGNPLNDVDLIVVAGPYGKSTTITLLEAILKEAGRNVATVAADSRVDDSLMHFFGTMSRLKREQKHIVLIEMTEELLKLGALHGARIDTVVALGQDQVVDELLHMAPKHVVTPTELAAPEGTVEPYQQINFGDADNAEARIDNIKLYRHGVELKMTIDHQTKLEIASYLTGLANAHCIAASVAAAYVLGVDLEAMQEGIAEIDTRSCNFEVIKLGEPYQVIIDHASKAVSIDLAVESAKLLTSRRLLVVFDGLPSSDVIDSVKQRVDRIFVVSDEHDGRSDIDTAVSVKGAIEKATRSAKKGDTVLLLGASFRHSDIMSEEK